MGDVIGTAVSLQFSANIFQEPISSYIRIYIKKIYLPYTNTSYQQINAPAPPGICD